jgi:hypothetical protein
MAYRRAYRPLTDYLAAQSTSSVVLTLDEIAALMGPQGLPDVAYTNEDTWRSERRAYVQRWRALGWRARLDKANRRVIFTRDAEG